jgi:putative heme-binding domain-containing protein
MIRRLSSAPAPSRCPISRYPRLIPPFLFNPPQPHSRSHHPTQSPSPFTRSLWFHSRIILLLATGLLGVSGWERDSGEVRGEDPFLSDVRPTDPLTPAEQQQTFEVPPGFVVELVAAEPDILKPMNMAFDARGRLWVTCSEEYPYAAPEDRPGRDAIKILEDRTGDGVLETITTFADDLNIPIGIYPYQNGAIVFSIPSIWNLQDTTGDGVADTRTKLFGPMGWERDTHGMNNSFTRGFDGWLYACHGFNNETRVAGADGHEIHMQSGNTYRMRLDGSRIEQFTWGQVNPFGMAMDPLFNLFTADCHSKPIYQLVRGGYYPSFGKPHDGLGFVPPMMEHLHGSTAIAGVVCYEADEFPEAYHGNMFSGNVMTSRVNRNSLVYHGSTILCREEEDFVKTTDPWFRPVDIQLGPDGALYVADFYNRIIGHYEVPLDHPGRDRTSGRIWRIRYVGEQQASLPKVPPPGKPVIGDINLGLAELPELLLGLSDRNQTRRQLALEQIVDRIGPEAGPTLRETLRQADSEHAQAAALWGLHRLDLLDDASLERCVQDEAELVRTHSMKVLSELPGWSSVQLDFALAGLNDPDPFVRRAAADALACHPEHEAVTPLLQAGEHARRNEPQDRLLAHGLRIALRNQLREPSRFELAEPYLTRPEAEELSVVAQAIPSPESAEFLIRYLDSHEVPRETAAEMVRHAARHIDPERADDVVQFARKQFAGEIDFQLVLLEALYQATMQRGTAPRESLRDWGQDVATSLLDSLGSEASQWTNFPVPAIGSRTAASSENPWVVETRVSADGSRDPFLGSLPRGEQLTGRLRSPEFSIPDELSFYLAGHSGFPDQPLTSDNYIQICDAETGETLVRTPPPRNDTAQLVTWSLSEFVGRKGVIEVVDGDRGGAYAWLAAGRFDPPVVEVPKISPSTQSGRRRAAAELVERFRLESLNDRLADLLRRGVGEPAALGAAARALLALEPDDRFLVLSEAIGEADLSDSARSMAIERLVRRDVEELPETISTVMQSAPARLQSSLAARLAGTAWGGDLLLSLVREGKASPRLLLEAQVQQRLQASDVPDVAEQLEELTAGLPHPSEEVAQRMEEARQGFALAARDLENGRAVFKRACANCHQLDGEGPLVGPQLDGIGNRGLERLLEDILDPNRNVDVAFRTTTLVLDSGKIVTGLAREERGETLVLIDEKGEEVLVPKSEIEEQVAGTLSLMPENVGSSLEQQDLFDLLAYLLTQREER